MQKKWKYVFFAWLLAALLGWPAATRADSGSAAEAEEEEMSADLGAEIVDFALEFVGCPYEWGGDSLTEGVDCSGFIHEVYEEFGIRVPRYSEDFLYEGEGIGRDLSEARPGDVICYDGHVALYIGDGQVVHASNSKPYPAGGIKISDADYREILSIRRFIG